MKKGFILGLTTGVILTGASLVFANSQIQAILNNQIKVTLNGQVQEFKDETTNETQYPITYKDRTYLPLRTVANLVGVDVDYDASSNTAILNDNFNLRNDLDKLDFSNTLSDNGWKISSDGKTIKNGDITYTTNLTKNVKSFKVAFGQDANFVVLTEDGEVYYCHGGDDFIYFGKGYDGICGCSYFGGSQQRFFIAKVTDKFEGTGEEFNTYTIFNNNNEKITFTNGI